MRKERKEIEYTGHIIFTPEDISVMKMLIKGMTTIEISSVLDRDITYTCGILTRFQRHFGAAAFTKRKTLLGGYYRAIKCLSEEGENIMRGIIMGDLIPDGRRTRQQKRRATSCPPPSINSIISSDLENSLN